ncbi:MAG: ABC transporter permease [Solirubrobacteraceae bacterium]
MTEQIVASVDTSKPTAMGRLRTRLVIRDYAIVVSFLALFITLSVASSAFLTKANLLNLLDQSTAIGIIACAGTFVIIAGGFDLSVGAIYALTGVIAAKMALQIDPVIGLALGLAVGVVAGLINGLIITWGRVNSFIATLAAALVIVGTASAITNGELITVVDPAFTVLGTDKLLGVKYSIWIFVVVIAASWFLLDRTQLGRYIYAVGGNAAAASLSGVRVARVRVITFCLSGFAAGLAGIIIASRNATGQSDSGVGLELSVIAAIVIGGTSIVGGEGAIWRTVIGVLLLAMINNGFNLLNFNPTYQQMVQGGIILIAVIADARARGRLRAA